MFPVRPTLAALGVASLVLVGAFAAPAAPTGTPPELAQFYDQQIAFEPCAPYATTALDEQLFARHDCARVQVPLDYADPGGPRGEIALLRVQARGERIGSLLVNPGGPGASGMSHVATVDLLAQPLTAGPLGERFDVIGFDPRGVGASTPRADCYTDLEYDRNEAFDSGFVLEDLPDADAARAVAQRCTEGSGGPQALAGFGTSDVARDMDVLRAALGDEKLSFLGYSYGTELGAVYAEAFPQNVRALALDGAVDPDLTPDQWRLVQAENFQQAFDALAAGCAAAADCPLGPDPARATEAFQAIVRPLQDRPAPTTDGRGLTYDDAIDAVTGGLYVEASWPTITEGLAEVTAGRGDVLQGLRDGYLGRGPDGRYSNLSDAFFTIRCMDWPRRSPAVQTELARQVLAAAPIWDPGRPVAQTDLAQTDLAQAHHECEAWPEPPSRPEPWLTGDVDVPPTLTISVTGDPATPHQGGINLARALDGSLLTVDGAQHGVALFGQSRCVDRTVSDYLIDLRTPPADARCTIGD